MGVAILKLTGGMAKLNTVILVKENRNTPLWNKEEMPPHGEGKHCLGGSQSEKGHHPHARADELVSLQKTYTVKVLIQPKDEA